MTWLEEYFDAHTTGPGIWKWRHYFSAYARHTRKFRGTPASICEVGIYSGGSLGMWRDYLGSGCHVYGVDIQPECRSYEKDGVRIFIGDQGSRVFWKEFRKAVPRLDILIDDGSHKPDDQAVTLEEMLPHLSPGGVYICEDVHGEDNRFADYVNKLSTGLHAMVDIHSMDVLATGVTKFQAMVNSVHVYPYITVIEKNQVPPERFEAPRHGTEWQPFPV